MEKDSSPAHPPVSWGSPLSVCPSVRPSDLLALPRPSTTSFPSIPSRPRPPFQTQSFARSDRLLLRLALSSPEREREKEKNAFSRFQLSSLEGGRGSLGDAWNSPPARPSLAGSVCVKCVRSLITAIGHFDEIPGS